MPPADELNGIAYDKATRRIFITGKKWPRLYQIGQARVLRVVLHGHAIDRIGLPAASPSSMMFHVTSPSSLSGSSR